MTAAADASARPDPVAGPVARPRSPRRTAAAELARAGLAPLACALVVIVLLATWVIGGGGGAVSRVRIQVTRASVPMLAYTRGGATGQYAAAYLTIRNLSRTADTLLSASSPAAARILLTRSAGAHSAAAGLAIPAAGILSLSPFGADLVLVDPRPLTAGQDVVITLRFRHAGTITVDASVTPPGAP